MKRSTENCRRDDITKLSNEINVCMGDADGTLSHRCFNIREHMQGHIATDNSTFFKITQLMVSYQLICQMPYEHLCNFEWVFCIPNLVLFSFKTENSFVCVHQILKPLIYDHAEYIHLDGETGPFSLRNLKYN